MGRPVTYFDYVPVNIFPIDNQVPELANNDRQIPVPPAMVPEHIALGARPDQGPFASAGVEVMYPDNTAYELYNQGRGFYPLAVTWQFFTNRQPVRYDTYSQGVQPPRSAGRQKAGQSPTTGIYTGRQETESYAYYGGLPNEEDNI